MNLSLQRFENKVAVVTGASAGIGKALVELLVQKGLIVAGLARRVDRLEKHAKELSGAKGKLHPFQCDLTKKDDILATFEKITSQLGPIHILVNNAGLLQVTTIIDGEIDKWKTVLDTNVLGLAICTRQAIASMKAHNIKGHVVNINSVAGHEVHDVPSGNVYFASKFAVTALTETIRLEINREKLPIKMTSLSPGRVITEFIQAAHGGNLPPHIDLSKLTGLSGMDIAEATVYVLSTPEHVNIKEITVINQGAIY